MKRKTKTNGCEKKKKNTNKQINVQIKQKKEPSCGEARDDWIDKHITGRA